MTTSTTRQFGALPEPQSCQGRRFFVPSLTLVPACALVGWTEYWSAVAAFGDAKPDWFRSANTSSKKAAIHMVGAWASDHAMVFDHVATDDRRNVVKLFMAGGR